MVTFQAVVTAEIEHGSSAFMKHLYEVRGLAKPANPEEY